MSLPPYMVTPFPRMQDQTGINSNFWASTGFTKTKPPASLGNHFDTQAWRRDYPSAELLECVKHRVRSIWAAPRLSPYMHAWHSWSPEATNLRITLHSNPGLATCSSGSDFRHLCFLIKKRRDTYRFHIDIGATTMVFRL